MNYLFFVLLFAYFFKINVFYNISSFVRIVIVRIVSVLNILDPDQVGQSVGPDWILTVCSVYFEFSILHYNSLLLAIMNDHELLIM